MCKQLIVVSSVTYAIRGRDLLRMNRFHANIERLPAGDGRPGCGYGICVAEDVNAAVNILNAAGIKIRDIVPFNK